MRVDRLDRRMSYGFLRATPFLVIIAVAVRALRIPGVYHVIGGVLFAAISFAAWTLGAWANQSRCAGPATARACRSLLVAPFATVALCWVGLGPPGWQPRQRTRCATWSSLSWPSR
jgi:hypothetical protein